MTDLVSAGLARPAAIAIDLARHFLRLGAIALDEELAALFTGPALVVQAGVDHQAARAEGEALQVAETADLEIVVGAQLVGQLLRIQRPAFGEGVEGKDGADQRQAVGERPLPRMAGDTLVIGKVGKVVLAVQVRGAKVDPHARGDRPVLATRAAIGTGCAGFFGERQAAYLDIGFDQLVEGTRHLRGNPVDPVMDEIHDLLATRIALGKLVALVGA